MTVPAAAAWIGVPSGTPMSIPGWMVPHRGPKGLVIGPWTGQMKPAALGVAAGVSDDPPSEARIFASIAALDAAIACDSLISDCSCALVMTSARPFAARA